MSRSALPPLLHVHPPRRPRPQAYQARLIPLTLLVRLARPHLDHAARPRAPPFLFARFPSPTSSSTSPRSAASAHPSPHTAHARPTATLPGRRRLCDAPPPAPALEGRSQDRRAQARFFEQCQESEARPRHPVVRSAGSMPVTGR
jgi:hypothetical protein